MLRDELLRYFNNPLNENYDKQFAKKIYDYLLIATEMINDKISDGERKRAIFRDIASALNHLISELKSMDKSS